MEIPNNNHSMTRISGHQKTQYEKDDKHMAEFMADTLLERYSKILNTVKHRDNIKILEIGGGGGSFSLALHRYFSKAGCEIFLVDSTRYDTWEDFGDKITFIEESAENIEKIFAENTFDIIFANRVFHHFVAQKTWKETISDITDITNSIYKILKNEGFFCVMDHFYNGMLFDTSASRIIYALTSCKIPLFVKIFRKIDAMSAGVGVCFLSRKIWMDMFDKCGFTVDECTGGQALPRNFIRTLIYKILLFVKDTRLDVTMILKKKQ
jgi:ubiquinone/menaquinone biosynthesis C-methylase UbiE